jgi:hypothetical protein
MHISAKHAAELVDSLDYALTLLQDRYDNAGGTDDVASLTAAIENLQMIRLAYMLAQRNAAKEQRKGRANGPAASITVTPVDPVIDFIHRS